MGTEDAFGKRLGISLVQAALLLLAGVILGSAFNALRHDGLPWVREVSPAAAEGAIPMVSIHEAWAAYQKGQVLFVDARSASEFAAGHLPGALSVPVEQGQKSPFQAPAGKDIVIYCSDPACTKSAELAALLRARGVKGIRIMPEGWAGWFEAGLPFEENG